MNEAGAVARPLANAVYLPRRDRPGIHTRLQRPTGEGSDARSAMGRCGMKVGVIADTHGLLRPEVFDVFAEVDHILHAGDVGSADLLIELEALAPVTAVFGNTDGFDVRQRLDKVARCDLEGLRAVVTHGDQFGTPTAAKLRTAFPGGDILVYGHTHEPFLELYDYLVTVMNPGAAGPARAGLEPTVGILDLEAGLPPRGRIVPLSA